MTLSRARLHRWLPWVPAVVAVVFTLLMIPVVDRILAQQLVRQARFQVDQTARVYAAELSKAVSTRALELELLSRSDALQSTKAGPERQQAELDHLRQRSPAFVWVGLVALNGRVLAGSDGLLRGKSIATRPVYLHGLKGVWFGSFHAPVALKPELIRVGREVPGEIADLAMPVLDRQGRVQAVLAAHLDARAFSGLRDGVLGPPEVRKGLELAIVSEADAVLAGQMPSVPLQAVRWSQPELHAHAMKLLDADGRGHWVAWAMVQDAAPALPIGWRVVASQPEDQVLESAQTLEFYILASAGVAGLITGGMGTWWSRRLARPYTDILDSVALKLAHLPDGEQLAQVSHVLGMVRVSRRTLARRSPGEHLLGQILRDANRLEQILDQLPAAAYLLDETGRVQYWNQAAEAMFGVPHAEAIGASRDALWTWEVPPVPLQEVDEPGTWQFEGHARGPDGREVWGLWSERAVRDGKGEALGTLAQVRDLTAERLAARRLSEQGEVLSGIIQSSSDAVISTDTQGLITLFNPAAERIFQLRAADMMGRPLESLLAGPDRLRHESHLARFAQSGAARRPMGTGRVTGVRADGQEVILEASISQVTVQGRQVLTAMLRDVTDRVQAEHAQIRYQFELSELTHQLMAQEKTTTRKLAQLLHDQLGQSLTAMRLSLDALSVSMPPPVDDKVRQRLDSLGTLTRQALAEVRQALVELRPPLLDEQGLIAAVDNEVRIRQGESHTTRLVMLLSPDLGGMRWPSEVEYAAFMIVREALVNALQHASAHTVTVRLGGHARALVLAVEDDGSGIAPTLAMGRPGHLGVVGMRERALAIEGRLHVRGRQGGGTLVELIWEQDS